MTELNRIEGPVVILNISHGPTFTCDEDVHRNQYSGLDCWQPLHASTGQLRPISSADWQKGISLIKLKYTFFFLNDLED